MAYKRLTVFSAFPAYQARRQPPSGTSVPSISALLLLAIVHVLIHVTPAKAQTATLQGFVKSSTNDRPLYGANVLIQEITESESVRGISTDRYGFYQLRGVTPETYRVQVSHIGYTAFQDTVTLISGERRILSISLERGDEVLDELLIAPDEGITRRKAGRQRITSVDLSRIPTPAGGGDLASFLQTLPGVVATGDRGGQLFIRGGTPSENMVLMDGALIYQPFHIVGFFSVFPEDLVSGVDFYAGGFGPRYSGRISSVLDVQMRDGNRQETQGTASVSPFLGELILEGPLKRGESSWLVSMRRSLIEETSPFFLGEDQPLQFDSQFLKFTHFGRDNSRCSATALRTGDLGRLDLQSDDTFQWNNFMMGGHCILVPEESDVLIDTNISFSYMSNTTGHGEISRLTSSNSRVQMKIDLTQYSGDVRFLYGFYTNLKIMNYNLVELFRSQQSNEGVLLNSGIHMEASIPLGDRFRIQPGAAFSVFMEDYKPSIEPRLRGSWRPWGDEAEELYASVGLYRQPVTGVSDMRDVSSTFVAWMPVPIGGSQMEALHTLAGWQQRLGSGFQLSAEGYYKRLRHIPVAVWSTIAEYTTELSMADGRVYGSDIRLEYNRGRWYGFAGYGLNWIEYTSSQEHFNLWFGDPVQRYHPPHDRRHQVNSMVSLTMGDYMASLRWQLGTGLPFTRPMGFDGLLHFTNELPDVRSSYGTPRIIIDRPYEGRLPVYHRLDFSIERSFHFSVSRMRLQAGVINLYDHRNLFYYDVYTHRRIDQMPFAPYFSLKLEPR